MISRITMITNPIRFLPLFVAALLTLGCEPASEPSPVTPASGAAADTDPWGPMPTEVEPFYFTDFDAWVGQPLSSQALARLINRPIPEALKTGRGFVMLYRSDCEHCHHMLEQWFTTSVPAPTVAVQVPDTDPANAMPFPSTLVERRALPAVGDMTKISAHISCDVTGDHQAKPQPALTLGGKRSEQSRNHRFRQTGAIVGNVHDNHSVFFSYTYGDLCIRHINQRLGRILQQIDQDLLQLNPAGADRQCLHFGCQIELDRPQPLFENELRPCHGVAQSYIFKLVGPFSGEIAKLCCDFSDPVCQT